MLIDIHTHILPRVDDGAKTLQESVHLLKLLQKNGTDAVWATPHFYAHLCNLEDYTARAEAAYARLQEAVADAELPPVYLGYEVKYFKGMATNPVLPRLTMAGTGYILVELPYQDIDPRAIDEICEIKYNTGITPILAHIDRYLGYKNYGYVLNVLENGDVLAQVNADTLLAGRYKKQALRLITDGYAQFLASDTHTVKERPPRTGEAIALLQKKWGIPQTDAFLQQAAVLLPQK